MDRPRIPRRLRRLRNRILAHRRPLAAVLAALAVASALQANAAPPPSRVAVLTAAHDLSPGATLTASDVETVGFDPASVPAGVLGASEAIGRTTIGPVRAGEPLTDVRLLGDALLDRYPGSVAAPVRIGDAASVDLVRVGDQVSVLAADPQDAAPAVTLAASVPVIAVPRRRRTDPGITSGALIVVAVDAVTARHLAGAAVSSFLSVVIVR